MKLGIYWLFGVCALLSVGCSDDSTSNQHAEQRSGLIQTQAQPSWLDATSKIEPATWLIEREANSGRTLSAEDADKVRQSIATAAKLLKEDPRMIANRAVQLETMLDPTDGRETAVWLVTELAEVVTEPGRVEGFGALGQQYYNMRKAGLSERDALRDLSRRYGSRG
jgi:hypothetical protein